MAFAQNIEEKRDNTRNHYFLSKISPTFMALCQRLWWHTKGYTTVFGMMTLTLASLGFLYIHWSTKKLTQFQEQETVVEQE
ncbi:hypothetical protein [Nostoc parmelioides]|uniref:Uncharacterized protein n=1 Tax=Nostoc parmelioides FACHB-3921 TaxID=2692909 RepID=A0ABR8BAS9_9NOSO|nr:hypothetical protein [Nostoc parmelioides]MBD2249971.1 hypothetical protein [Nostoc parmelioides FACHB-3921]